MNKIVSELKGAKTVAIAGHVRPDGDCIGSCMAMYNYIQKYFSDIHVDVYLEEIPEVFSFIKSTNKIKNTYEENIVYDVFIALDASDRERLGEADKYFSAGKKTICIDHHISNLGFAMVNYIYPEASSTSELVFELLEEDKIDSYIAESIYTGIVHDTGVFQYSNTSEKTMNIAGKLMSKGIDFSKIIDDTFYKKTYVQNQILGRALLESILLLDGKCIVSGIRNKEMDFYGVSSKDFDGIVNQLRITDGVECAIFLYETGNQEYKVSMRSSDRVNVSDIALYFGGGGHRKAAGCTMVGTLHDVINNITGHIEKQLQENTCD